MALVAVLLWDGFLILGEGLGLRQRTARRFADIAWCVCAALVTVWALAMIDVAMRR